MGDMTLIRIMIIIRRRRRRMIMIIIVVIVVVVVMMIIMIITIMRGTAMGDMTSLARAWRRLLCPLRLGIPI